MVLRRGVPVGCRFTITRVGAPAHHIEQPKAAALVTAELDADRPIGIAGRDRWFESTLLQRRVRRTSVHIRYAFCNVENVPAPAGRAGISELPTALGRGGGRI